MNIKNNISLANILACFLFIGLMAIARVGHAQINLAYTQNSMFPDVTSFSVVGGFIGPVPPPILPNNYCARLNSHSNTEFGRCTEQLLHSPYVGCTGVAIVKSITNKRTGRALLPDNQPSAVNGTSVGDIVYASGELFGKANAQTSTEERWLSVLCSAHVGDTAPANATNDTYTPYHYLHPKQGFTPGDSIELCVQERFINAKTDFTRSGGLANRFSQMTQASTGQSYCTTIDSVAPSCEIVGNLEINLGSVGIGKPAYGTTENAMLVCPSTSSIKVTMVKENPEGNIALKGPSSNTINAKVRMKVGSSPEATEWSGIVNSTTPIIFSADVANAGNEPGEFSGQTVIILNNN
ncbi:TPA: hypothetical protein VEO38_002856 [Providencia alcalifaciens]|nr:hypothetical protein [Providencia alcalifaciens]